MDSYLLRLAARPRVAPLVLQVRCAVGAVPDEAWGPGYVAGTVTVDGEPASLPVRLYERASGRLVRKTQSAADGAYRFDRLALATYLVVAHDSAEVFNAATADLITPALPEA